jgi:hypothetical protein
VKQFTILTLLLSVLFSCKQKTQNIGQVANGVAADTASLRKLLEKSQKPGVNIAEMLFNADTLKIVTPLPHLYYPFGKHSEIKDIEKAITNSTVKDIYLKDSQTQDSTAITQITTLKSNIKFVFDDEQHRWQIVSADINDSNFHMLNHIHIGMSKEELLGVLFNKKPAIAVNNIKLISALTGINHYYIFKDDKLAEIKMVTDYTFEGK